MLSVRLPQTLEMGLSGYCAKHRISKSQVVQQALVAWLNPPAPALTLRQDDPLLKWVGVAKGGMTTDELMQETRGDDWNRG